MVLKLLQPAKARIDIVFVVEGRVTVSRLLHPLKAYWLISVIDPRLVTEVIPSYIKASFPRYVRCGRLNSPDNEHPLNGLLPIDTAPDKSEGVICKEEQS